MKTSITLSSTLIAIMFVFSNCSVQKNQDSGKKISQSETITTEATDTLQKNVPYKIIRSTPTVKYSIRKIGNGEKVEFSARHGFRYLPKLSFEQSSGHFYKNGKKQGFQDVVFPFKCKIVCNVNFFENRFDPLPGLINDFEIEIYEPGNWHISFSR